jgi:hypothetical protein
MKPDESKVYCGGPAKCHWCACVAKALLVAQPLVPKPKKDPL